MHLDRAPLVAGHRATKVELVIRNASDGTVRLTSQLEKVHLVDRDGRGAAVIYTDAVGVAQLELAPGAVQRLTTWVMPFACGDVPMLDRVLKPGRYRVTGSLRWGRRHDSGRWSTREREVRVVRR
jgi:hypothetical protein